MIAPTEGQASINGRQLHWRAWGEPSAPPVLALHGWLDNAASFDVLAPLLRDIYLVAVDMPGHGLSDHRPPPGSYNSWDDLLDILALVDHLGWDRFSLLGHSRGAIISSLLAGSLPDRIEKLALLDGLLVGFGGDEDAPRQLGQYLVDHQRSRKAPRGHPDFQSALEARCRAAVMSERAALPIVKRGLRQDADGLWYWRSDWRLTLASAVRFTPTQAMCFYDAMTCPILVLLASSGFRQHSLDEEFSRLITEKLRIEEVAGSHHWHLEEPAVELAQRLNGFFASEPG